MPDAERFIGYSRALALTLEHIQCLPPVRLPLEHCVDLAAARDLFSKADAPSGRISLKDGFAVRWADIRHTANDRPARLDVAGSTAAGEADTVTVRAGTAVRVLSGAVIPEGADTVVADEFAVDEKTHIRIDRPTAKNRNILASGSDVLTGERIASRGNRLTPGRIGLLTAGGFGAIPVIPRPRLALIATGTEIVPPGRDLPEGKVFASNLMALRSWCTKFGMPTQQAFVADDAAAIGEQLMLAADRADVIVTSGGAWTSKRDWMARVLDRLGWRKVYHRVRMGPGKAVGFGLLETKPVFILPGGPPSNLLAFLQLALPGLFRMAGMDEPPLRMLSTKLAVTVSGQIDWTQFIFGRIVRDNRQEGFVPLKSKSRLKDMAEARAVLAIPEGIERMDAGSRVSVTSLD